MTAAQQAVPGTAGASVGWWHAYGVGLCGGGWLLVVLGPDSHGPADGMLFNDTWLAHLSSWNHAATDAGRRP